MAKFSAQAEAMRQAAQRLEQESDTYKQASDTAGQAGEQLASSWEGDAQKVFAREQQQATQWYRQMAAITKQYAAHLRTAASEYERADAEAAGTIGRT